MAIPNEALQKILLEIEQKASFSQQQIGIVKAQLAAKNRESRMLELTVNEVSSLSEDTKVYEGVGKIFVQCPIGDVRQRLVREGETLKSEKSNLDKKLTYLETTYRTSTENLEKLLRHGPS